MLNSGNLVQPTEQATLDPHAFDFSHAPAMFGLLNINKPADVTSRDVVNRIQRLVRPARVGHAGTLDPLATGVLVVCLGQATRLIEYVQRMRKRYRATFLLGRQSDTEDTTGRIIELIDPPRPTRQDILSILPKFTGEIEQLPSAFSALKIQGTPAYKIARRGEQPSLSPRRIHIDAIEVVQYEYPRLVLDVACGGGTYIRALGRDLGKSLETAAVMSGLMRTAIGNFVIEDALDLTGITASTVVELIQPASRAVEELIHVTLGDDEVRRLANGLSTLNRFDVRGEQIAAFDKAGTIRAIVCTKADQIFPVKCFLPPNDNDK